MRLRDGEVGLWHPELGEQVFVAGDAEGGAADEWLFTENESNMAALYDVPNESAYTKDSFHRYVVDGETGAVNPEQHGTKCAALFRIELAPGAQRELRFGLADSSPGLGQNFDEVFRTPKLEHLINPKVLG